VKCVSPGGAGQQFPIGTEGDRSRGQAGERQLRAGREAGIAVQLQPVRASRRHQGAIG